MAKRCKLTSDVVRCHPCFDANQAGWLAASGKSWSPFAELLQNCRCWPSTADRAARDARGAHDCADPAMPGRRRLGCRKPPPPALAPASVGGPEFFCGVCVAAPS